METGWLEAQVAGGEPAGVAGMVTSPPSHEVQVVKCLDAEGKEVRLLFCCTTGLVHQRSQEVNGVKFVVGLRKQEFGSVKRIGQGRKQQLRVSLKVTQRCQDQGTFVLGPRPSSSQDEYKACPSPGS